MTNRVVIFPSGKQTSANSYSAACDTAWAARDGGGFSYVTVDAFGQWVVPYLGPPFEYPVGTVFEEPAPCLAARDDGVLADTWTPPEEE